MTSHTAKSILSTTAAAAVLLITGCADDKSLQPVFANERFQADDAPRRVDEVFARQAANADREDGTLYAQHFTDGHLNGLGYQKLSSMAYGPAAGKLTVYLDLPKTETYSHAEDEVRTTLSHGGMADGSYAIVQGANPNLGAPAVAGLNGLGRQTVLDANGPGPIASPAVANTR